MKIRSVVIVVMVVRVGDRGRVRSRATDCFAGCRGVEGERAGTDDRVRARQFGSGWVDVNRNGCDTRDDILRRDLTQRRIRPFTHGCVVTAGTLHDPYTRTVIRYVRGGGSEVDIDHVVALGDAWQKGAQRWAYGKRVALANDPLNLLAVSASANRQKGDGDAATWLPANKSFRCSYVARQVAVKLKFGLWVTGAERDAMRRVLSACPTMPLPARGYVAGLLVGWRESSRNVEASDRRIRLEGVPELR